MNREALFELLQELPDDLVEEVHHYAEFLSEKVKTNQQLQEDQFWKLIAMINWSEAENDEKVNPLLEKLATLSDEAIFAFQDQLALKLKSLDGPDYFDQYGSGEMGASADSFLYGRCYVIGQGRAYYHKVLEDATQILPDVDLEHLLYAAEIAYERKHGQELERLPVANYESFYNTDLWGERAISLA